MFTPFLEDSTIYTNYSSPPNYFKSLPDNFLNCVANVNDKELLLWVCCVFKISNFVLVRY